MSTDDDRHVIVKAHLRWAKKQTVIYVHWTDRENPTCIWTDQPHTSVVLKDKGSKFFVLEVISHNTACEFPSLTNIFHLCSRISPGVESFSINLSAHVSCYAQHRDDVVGCYVTTCIWNTGGCQFCLSKWRPIPKLSTCTCTSGGEIRELKWL
jgi:hypothetical protein